MNFFPRILSVRYNHFFILRGRRGHRLVAIKDRCSTKLTEEPSASPRALYSCLSPKGLLILNLLRKSDFKLV